MSQIYDANNDAKSDELFDLSDDSNHSDHNNNFNYGGNSLSEISEQTDYLVDLKIKLNSRMKHACTNINALHKSTSQMTEQYNTMKEDVRTLPSLTDWIKATSSEIHQLKSQIQFLHNIMHDS